MSETSRNDPPAMGVGAYEFMVRRDNFKKHYLRQNGNPITKGLDIEIPWLSLSDLVTSFKVARTLGDDEVALRLVLCYNPSTNTLYYRLQLCKMAITEARDHGRVIYELLEEDSDPWYKIALNTIATTTVKTLSDRNYLDHVYYNANHQTINIPALRLLSTDVTETLYVRNVVFPWGQEIKRLFTENGGTPENAGSYTLHFVPVTYGSGTEYGSALGDSVVEWPHEVALYLNELDDLDNLDYSTTAPLKNKAANLVTLCPPKCDQYILPLNIWL